MIHWFCWVKSQFVIEKTWFEKIKDEIWKHLSKVREYEKRKKEEAQKKEQSAKEDAKKEESKPNGISLAP